MYLLDTNVISELRKPRPHGAVLSWIEGIANHDLNISAVSFGEIQAGIEITRTQDPAKAAELSLWLARLSQSFRPLPMDASCFRTWAKLMCDKSDDLYEDAMIAATAIEHSFTVVTRNVKDFVHFPVDIFDPFSPR
jgi:toxin FitB